MDVRRHFGYRVMLFGHAIAGARLLVNKFFSHDDDYVVRSVMKLKAGEEGEDQLESCSGHSFFPPLCSSTPIKQRFCSLPAAAIAGRPAHQPGQPLA